MGENLTIGDDRLVVAFDEATGAVVALDDRVLGSWLRAETLGSLFVIEIPRHGDRTVVIETSQQQVSSAVRNDDETAIVLRWERLVTSTGEHLDGWVEVSASVSRGALEAQLSFRIEAGGVEAVRFPSLRGIRPQADELELRGVDYSTGTQIRLLPVFASTAPYWGTLYPDYASGNMRPEIIGNPTSPFAILATKAGGLTILPAVPTLEFIGWRASLEPGYLDSLARDADPATGAVTFDAIHFPVLPGVETQLPAMVVSTYDGPWHRGLGVYRERQGETRRSKAAWLSEPRSWLQVQLMSTEGEPRYTFDTLTEIIEECAAAGIGAIQIVGWNDGGQDGLVPWHRPSEKLGGEPGLRRALERARELDVATVLYVKYVWVEKPGPNWAELEPFVALDANGQPYAQPGPTYLSSRKRYGISTPWYVPLCFGVAELRARFADEIALFASWGADGVLADESLYHGRSLFCFSDSHGHAPGACTFLWDADFVEDMRAKLGEQADTFVIAAEGAYDNQFEHYDVSYFRSASMLHRPVGRMLRPQARIVTALTGSDDRNMVAQCLLYGYAMSLEPYNFKGRPGDMPRTVELATRADALRSRYAAWLWDGTLVEDHEVSVTPEDGTAHTLFTVWRDDASTARLVVIANYGEEPASLVVSGIEASDSIDLDGNVQPLSGGRVQLPARGVAILVPTPLSGGLS